MKELPTQVLPLSPGTAIERYTILSVLGQGACGIAYLVRDEELGRRVMLKEHAPEGLCQRMLSSGEIQPLPGANDRYIQSLSDFLQEATVLTKLRHPAAPEVYEVFEAGGTACCVLSYVEGQDLPHWLGEDATRRSLLPLVLAEALRALGKLHRLGVRHRDIKPGHLILNEVGAVNFIDFGAACVAGEEDAAALVPAFTPPYSPPEQGVQNLECAASDLYALAATFYEVTSGHKPPTATARLEGEAHLPLLADNESLCAEFPPAYLHSLDRALALEPQHRFSTAELWLTTLTRTEPAAESPRRRRVLLLGLLLVAVSALIIWGAGWWYIERRNTEEIDNRDVEKTENEPTTNTELPAVTRHEYALPAGVLAEPAGGMPAWGGVCSRIDLVGAEDLTEDYLPPVFAQVWRQSRVQNASPVKLGLVLLNRDGSEIARSVWHRYNADTKTLTFIFASPLQQLPEGWKASALMPMQKLEEPLHPVRAQKVVFYTMKPESLPQSEAVEELKPYISCPFGNEPNRYTGAALPGKTVEALRALALAGYPFAARLLAENFENQGQSELSAPWRDYAEQWGAYLPFCQGH